MTDGCSRLNGAAILAIVGLAWFAATVIVLPLVTADLYDPFEQTISELALGQLGILMDGAFLALGIGGVALAYGLRRSLDGGGLAPQLLEPVMHSGCWGR